MSHEFLRLQVSQPGRHACRGAGRRAGSVSRLLLHKGTRHTLQPSQAHMLAHADALGRWYVHDASPTGNTTTTTTTLAAVLCTLQRLGLNPRPFPATHCPHPHPAPTARTWQGRHLGPPLLCLMSPQRVSPALGDPHRQGRLFPMALACPVMAMCVLCAASDPLPAVLQKVQVGGGQRGGLLVVAVA